MKMPRRELLPGCIFGYYDHGKLLHVTKRH